MIPDPPVRNALELARHLRALGRAAGRGGDLARARKCRELARHLEAGAGLHPWACRQSDGPRPRKTA